MSAMNAVSRALMGMSLRDRRALFIVIFFLGVVVGYIQLVEPLVIRFDDVLSRLERANKLTRGYSQKIRMLPRREAKLEELREKKRSIESYFQAIPVSQSSTATALLDELTSYMNLSGAKVVNLVPDAETLPEEVGGRLHEVVISGDYRALRRYLYLLETSPRKYELAELQISPSKERALRGRIRFFEPINQIEGNNLSATQTSSGGTLEIGVYGSVDDLPLYLVSESNHLDDSWIDLSLVSAGTPEVMSQRLLSGQVDVVAASLYDLLRYRLEGVPVRAILPLGSPPSRAVVATSTTSVLSGGDALRGQKIGVEPHGISEMLLLDYLASEKMSREDIQIIYLDRRALVRHLQSGMITAGVFTGMRAADLPRYELTLFKVLEGETPNWHSYMIAHADALDQRSAILLELAKRLMRANRSAVQGGDDLLEKVVGWLGQETQEWSYIQAGETLFPDNWAAGRALLLSKKASVEYDYLQQSQLAIGEPLPDLSFEDLFDTRIIDAIAKELKK